MSFELQKLLFEGDLSRKELLNYTSKREIGYKIQVFRNHSFELVEHTIAAYLDYAGIGVSFSYSGYDDSFSFLELDSAADLILIWIDMTRYNSETAERFLLERLHQLRVRCQKPILVIPFGQSVLADILGVEIFNLTEIEENLGQNFLDERAKAITGTALSNKAMLSISRNLGLRYLPTLLRPALKAIVVDLDNTLYQGVLGEDGVQDVTLTEGHKKLQEYLKQLAKRGFFLCVASKNDADDVEELFRVRQDFPLKRDDFTVICASWNVKTDSIQKIVDFLNINTDSIVFVDDNIGELIAVQMTFPAIKLIQANENGEITKAVLKEFPGLLKLGSSLEDSIRKDDVKANQNRQELQRTMSPEEYIRSLKIRLTFCHNHMEQAQRISELANKTNQFIFSYQRYTQAEIEMRMSSKDYLVVAISLADRLSDSGLIGVCVGKSHGSFVEIEECFISCRALGRGIDDVIVLGAIRQITEGFHVTKVKVAFQTGPRNAPAERFVSEHLQNFLLQESDFFYEIPGGLLNIIIE